MKTCRTCGIGKNINEYYKHARMSDGYLNICKDCTKKRVHKYRGENLARIQEYDRNRPNAKERTQKYKEYINNLTDAQKKARNITHAVAIKQIKDKHPEKVKATNCVNNALRDKRLVKPDSCSRCGCSNKKIQGHHWSYLEEHWLDVIWLCTTCHAQEHKRLREIERNKKAA